MKKISTDAIVEDLYGLVEDLKKRSFGVLNVATDQRGTYVYLNDSEEKDPLPVVMEWVGKPAPKMTLKEWQARVKAAQAQAPGDKKSFLGKIMGFLMRKKEPEARVVGTLFEAPDPVASDTPAEPPAPIDPKFFRKIL